MPAPIPYVRAMEPRYGEAVAVSPLIRRVLANNPGPFTFLGTGVYVVGSGEVAVIDPGPDLPEHIDALQRVLAGERVTHILVTHDHLDHSPAARALAQATGAKIYGSGKRRIAHDVSLEEGDDSAFRPDVAIADGDVFAGPDWTLTAVETPGHTSNHIAFALKEENALFSGDHVMGWSTTVVTPPDGDMDAYIASLERVRDGGYATLYPTHGPPVGEPAAFVQALIDHRFEREAQILAAIGQGHARIRDMVTAIYTDVDPRLHPAAAYSVWAHLIRLVRLGRVKTEGAPALDSAYMIA